MFTESGPAEHAPDVAPHGWIATGPFPAGVSGIDPLPTGPVPVTTSPASTVPTSSPSARVILQAGVVLLAAGLVGLVVFGVLRSAADPDSAERADVDRSDGLAIDPGPGISNAGGGEPSSKRGTAGVGQRSGAAEDGADDDPAGDGRDPASPSTTAAIPAETEREPGATDRGQDPSGRTSADDRSGQSSNPNPRPGTPTTGSFGRSTTAITSQPPNRPTTTRARPSTRPTVGSSITTRPVTSTTGRPGTTRPVTTGPPPTRPPTSGPSTTARPTTTAAPTTTTIPLPASLIVAPVNGSTVSWEARLNLRANPVPGADSYCWILAGSGGELTQCSDGTELGLPARRTVPGPGPVKIRAEARTDAGAVLLRQEISIDLLARQFVSSPTARRSVALDDGLRLQARPNPSADRYCWTLAQGSTRSGPLCTADRRLVLAAGSPSLAGFEPGPVTVRASAELDGGIIGLQNVTFEFTAS